MFTRLPEQTRQVIAWEGCNNPEADCMEFRLTYEGQLLSGNKGSRTEHKHEIRRAFHPQLKKFWTLHPGLRAVSETNRAAQDTPASDPNNNINVLAERFRRSYGFRFVPLVRANVSVLCSVDILFLRPEQPGKIILEGDIDNRLKTLFDAFKVPREGKELEGLTPTADEDPFYCLLEDDGLITHAAVTTDYLLQPTGKSPDIINDARLVITVNIKPYSLTVGMLDGNSQFA